MKYFCFLFASVLILSCNTADDLDELGNPIYGQIEINPNLTLFENLEGKVMFRFYDNNNGNNDNPPRFLELYNTESDTLKPSNEILDYNVVKFLADGFERTYTGYDFDTKTYRYCYLLHKDGMGPGTRIVPTNNTFTRMEVLVLNETSTEFHTKNTIHWTPEALQAQQNWFGIEDLSGHKSVSYTKMYINKDTLVGENRARDTISALLRGLPVNGSKRISKSIVYIPPAGSDFPVCIESIETRY